MRPRRRDETLGHLESQLEHDAVVLYHLAAHPGEMERGSDPEIVDRAVSAQWRGDPPDFVEDWLTGR